MWAYLHFIDVSGKYSVLQYIVSDVVEINFRLLLSSMRVVFKRLRDNSTLQGTNEETKQVAKQR